MLVLSRKTNESVKLVTPYGVEILVKVLCLSPGVVKIGFKAPANVKILREEVSDDEGKNKARLAFMVRNSIDPSKWDEYIRNRDRKNEIVNS